VGDRDEQVVLADQQGRLARGQVVDREQFFGDGRVLIQ